MVLITHDERNKAQWILGTMTEVYLKRDGKVRAVRMRAGKLYLERAIQQLYPFPAGTFRKYSLIIFRKYSLSVPSALFVTSREHLGKILKEKVF